MSNNIVAKAKPQLIRRKSCVVQTIPNSKPLVQQPILPQIRKALPEVVAQPIKIIRTEQKTVLSQIRPIESAVSRQTAMRHDRKPSNKKSEVRYITSDPEPYSISKITSIYKSGVGKVLVIIGNGPSILEIKMEDLKDNSNIDTFSINKPDFRVWPTTHWAFFDQSQLIRNEDLWNGFEGNIFNSTAIKKQKAKSMQFKNIGGKGWSRDLLKGIYIGRSSVYAAMQIALWMQYDHIYIVGCLPDGEKILTSRGMVAIDSLLDCDLVYSTDGFKPITGYQRRWYEGTLVSLKTRLNNIPLNVTGEHPILVKRDDKNVFIPADDLIIGDMAVYPIDMTIVDHNRHDDFWWLVGVYAAEGYIKKVNNKYDYAVLCLGTHEVDFIQEVKDKAFSSLKCKVTGDARDRSTAEQIVNSDAFGKFVIAHIGRGSLTKFLSDVIMKLPLSKQAAFISGYCRGDGSIFRRKQINKDECTFSTASESLAEGLQKMLLRFGVISSVVRSNRPSGFDTFNTGKFGIRHHVTVIGSALDILSKWCGWKVETSGKSSLFGTELINNHLFVRIREINKSSFSGFVNNIEISGPHTFASRLLMTHNCDMHPEGLFGKLHFYGINPDVKPDIRAERFIKEAEFYDYAAGVLTEIEKSKFTFCSQYNQHGFVKKFNSVSNEEGMNKILSHAKTLNQSQSMV